LADTKAAVELLEFQADDELEQELQTNLAQLNHSLEEREIEQLLSGHRDKNGAYLIINAPIDDLDAPDWLEMLLKMYARWGENRGYKVELIEYSSAEYVGINSATLEIDGRYACGFLKSETGTHLLKRQSPFNLMRKRPVTATIEVVPMHIELEIPQQDLEIILPPQGQNHNGFRVWVNIVHKPTGVSAMSNSLRTQLQNKEKALAILTSKLFARMERQEIAEIAGIQSALENTVLNQPIREYQLPSDSDNRGKVIDFRTSIETTAVGNVLDGKLDPFLKASVLLKNRIAR
jgi:peptide chain release factor 2